MYSPMTVSLVGRIASGSASFLPPPWVTTANSGLNPSTCSASRSKKLIGISNGKYALRAPAALIRSSTSARIRSHIAYPFGRMTMVARAGPFSASFTLVSTC